MNNPTADELREFFKSESFSKSILLNDNFDSAISEFYNRFKSKYPQLDKDTNPALIDAPMNVKLFNIASSCCRNILAHERPKKYIYTLADFVEASSRTEKPRDVNAKEILKLNDLLLKFGFNEVHWKSGQ